MRVKDHKAHAEAARMGYFNPDINVLGVDGISVITTQ